MMCLLTEINEQGVEIPAPVYLNKMTSVELKDNCLLINGIVKIPTENLLEIKFKEVIK